MLALLKLIPLKDWLYCAALALLLAGFGWYTLHERHMGEAHELAAVKAENAKVTAAAQKQVADLTNKYTAQTAAIQETYSAELQAEHAAAAADADRLRQLAAYYKSHPVLGSPAAAGSPPAAGGSVVVGLGEVSAELAADLRAARDDLAACYADRAALTGK